MSFLVSLTFLFLLSGCTTIFASGAPLESLSALSANAHFIAQSALFISLVLAGVITIGMLLKRFLKLPEIAGQIIGGIILGPSLINIASFSLFNTSFTVTFGQQMSALPAAQAILFFIGMISALITVPSLLWMAGHETDLPALKKVGFVAVMAGILGALVPLVLIGFFGYSIGFSLAQSIGLGLIFSATSVSIPVAMLIGLNKMKTRVAGATLAAAVVDDIVAVILLSLFFIVIPGAGADAHSSLLSSLGSLGAAFVLFAVSGICIMPRILSWVKNFKDESLLAAVAFILSSAYFVVAELIGGLAGITGSYFAGLFHARSDAQHSAYKILQPFVQTILLPLFLGSIGLTLDLSLLSAYQWAMALIIMIVAIASKCLACALTTWLSNRFSSGQRWSLIETFLFGAAMTARGEVGLVIASIMKAHGLLSAEWYALAVVVIVLTTLATPALLSWGFYLQGRHKATHLFGASRPLEPADFAFLAAELERQGRKVILKGSHAIALDQLDIQILKADEGIQLTGSAENIEKTGITIASILGKKDIILSDTTPDIFTRTQI